MLKIDGASEQFLVALRQVQQAAQRAQQQISSGLRVSSVADEPHGVPALLQLQTDIAAVGRVKQNLARVRAEVDTGEGALQDAVKLLDQARAFALQGATGIDTETRRPILARQVAGLLEQMVGLSRVQSEGRFVFSGDLDQGPVYQLNLSSPSGVDQLADPAATRAIQHPNGTTFAVGLTAQNIFDARDGNGDPVDANVFNALNSLRIALEQNDDAGIEAAIGTLRAASDHLGQRLGWYGDLQSRIEAATQTAEKFQVEATVRLSEMRDADMPAAIVELTQSQTQQQAALSAQASIARLSLFDFLR